MPCLLILGGQAVEGAQRQPFYPQQRMCCCCWRVCACAHRWRDRSGCVCISSKQNLIKTPLKIWHIDSSVSPAQLKHTMSQWESLLAALSSWTLSSGTFFLMSQVAFTCQSPSQPRSEAISLVKPSPTFWNSRLSVYSSLLPAILWLLWGQHFCFILFNRGEYNKSGTIWVSKPDLVSNQFHNLQ